MSGNMVKFCGVRVLHNKRYLKHPFSDSHKIEGGGLRGGLGVQNSFTRTS